MPSGHINEPQTLVQEREMKLRFERDVVRGDVPPYHLVPERLEETHKDFIGYNRVITHQNIAVAMFDTLSKRNIPEACASFRPLYIKYIKENSLNNILS